MSLKILSGVCEPSSTESTAFVLLFEVLDSSSLAELEEGGSETSVGDPSLGSQISSASSSALRILDRLLALASGLEHLFRFARVMTGKLRFCLRGFDKNTLGLPIALYTSFQQVSSVAMTKCRCSDVFRKFVFGTFVIAECPCTKSDRNRAPPTKISFFLVHPLFLNIPFSCLAAGYPPFNARAITTYGQGYCEFFLLTFGCTGLCWP
jgi:hypothetical protein